MRAGIDNRLHGAIISIMVSHASCRQLALTWLHPALYSFNYAEKSDLLLFEEPGTLVWYDLECKG